MPIPFLLAGLGIAAGALGVGGHLSAESNNDEAQKIASNARNLYDNAKYSLERAQHTTEQALLKLGNRKKETLDCSMKQFLGAYEKIKQINVTESVGLDEVSNLAFAPQDALQIREMSDIYSSTASTAATGVATGTAIALAASGALPIIGGDLAVAGSCLAIGEVGLAAEVAGSALSFGAAMTPLAAIAAL
jgi:hypothetical protein